MATQRSSFSKLQRDRDKQAKAAAKRDRRQDRDPAIDGEEVEAAPVPTEAEQAEVLEQIARLHQEFDAKVIDFETFEERKALLMARLPTI
jgi:hypothetical protein